MNHVDWSDCIRIGIPGIDAEHKRLIALLNEFLLAEQAALPPAAMVARLDAFVTEAERHFASEERMLDRNDYPELAWHRSEHQRLLGQLRHFRECLCAGALVADHASEAADYLRAWVLRHMLEDDQAYRPFVMRLT